MKNDERKTEPPFFLNDGRDMTHREQAYVELLQWGLLQIRNLAYGKHVEPCEIEADHLQNIPSLLEEANERRHECYIRGERDLYLERLRNLRATECLKWAEIYYAKPWRVLAAAAGLQLSE